MKILLTLIFVAALGYGIYYYSVTLWEDTGKPIQSGSVVVAIGDSLVEGVGAETPGGFVAMLSRKIGIEIDNQGYSGDTTGTALLRLDRDALAKQPDVTLVLLGGNDALQRIAPEVTFANLEAVIRRLKNGGSKVLLLGVRGGLFFDRYDSEFERLAESENVEFVPDVLDGIWGRDDRMFDEIHPNETGYRMIAEKVEPVLRRMLQDNGL
jgi:lysophospholipase L1-like esterase